MAVPSCALVCAPPDDVCDGISGHIPPSRRQTAARLWTWNNVSYLPSLLLDRTQTCVQKSVIFQVFRGCECLVTVTTLVRPFACVSAADVVSELFFAGEEAIAIRPVTLLYLFAFVLLVMQLQLLRVGKGQATLCENKCYYHVTVISSQLTADLTLELRFRRRRLYHLMTKEIIVMRDICLLRL